MKIIYVVNEASFFLSHRLPLAEEALRRGFDVLVVCGADTGERLLEEAGLRVTVLPLSRSGFNPLEELRTLRALVKIYREESPDLVHHVTIKPVLYGTPAARWSRVPAVVNAVPGMGFVFIRRGYVSAMRRVLVNFLYRLSLTHPSMTMIFQNTEDLRAFVRNGIVRKQDAVLIRGSGVDLAEFRALPEPPEPITFVLVGRMLRHKGVVEYVDAARDIRRQHPSWRFLLVGDVDPGNPSSLSRESLDAWSVAGDVEWLGKREDIADVLADSHVVVLPSYREGLPKTLLEASAAGRAMVASDIAGCREVVGNEVTGLLVPIRESRELAAAMLRMGTDEAFRERCGRAARVKAEALFSIDDVVRDTFLVYQHLLSS